jgi:hypothetical protein
MSVRVTLFVVVAVAALTAVPAAAQDLTGSWQLTSQTQRGPQNTTITVVQNGSELTGTATFSFGGRRGGGGGGGRTIDLSNGTVNGNAFSFDIVLDFGGDSVTLSYSGTFEGDSMEGTIEGERGGGRPFSGERSG